MTRICCLLTTALIATWMPTMALAAGSMRCGSRIVNDGMRDIEVLGACGEPDFRDVQTPSADWIGDRQEWTYNFGSSQLLRIVRLRNGKVTDIDSDGYGFDGVPQPPCNPLDIVPGLSKFRLSLRCGAPATRRSMSLLVPLRETQAASSPQHVVPLVREEWVYNFGSSFLLRIVTLENGRVSDVRNGDRGFD